MGSKCTLVIAFGLVIPLYGCGAVDRGVTYLPLPESFRQPAPKVAEIEQPPDVHLIVRNNIAAIFMVAASPNNISVSVSGAGQIWRMDNMRQSIRPKPQRQIHPLANLSRDSDHD